ncbi:MAG: hypothetical protein KDA81_07110 [Planctomycetaceae bacterium]|nr:hypothetical protein [Planctomycetaceae bacterium]
MINYRYEAVDSNDVPVFGVTQAEDVVALRDLLAKRGLTLTASTELSLDALILAHQETLPRLYQLRVGEQLREAFLTGLPAHEAVRAIAAEPLSHPMAELALWLEVFAVVLFLFVGTLWWQFGILKFLFLLSALAAFVVAPAAGFMLRWFYRHRPVATLRAMADRLEAGLNLPSHLTFAAPAELRSVMASTIDEHVKARVAADMMPGLLTSNMRMQQFLTTLIGPLAVLGLVILGLYSAVLLIVPGFKAIFQDFGIELPGMTMALIHLSDLLFKLGSIGWTAFALSILLFIGLLALGIVTGVASEVLSEIPVFGMAFRWTMQARVSRILASLIRHDVPYSEALRIASRGSGFRSVAERGEILANELVQQTGLAFPTGKLSGLPISMLFVTESATDSDQRRITVAHTFQSLSEMLESASVGQGRILAVVVQSIALVLTGTVVGFGVISLFLPLIKLLNDLS